MSTPADGVELKAVCLRRGVFQIGQYKATHLPHPSLLASAWVIWDGFKAVAVVETFPKVREWITAAAKAGDAR